MTGPKYGIAIHPHLTQVYVAGGYDGLPSVVNFKTPRNVWDFRIVPFDEDCPRLMSCRVPSTRPWYEMPCDCDTCTLEIAAEAHYREAMPSGKPWAELTEVNRAHHRRRAAVVLNAVRTESQITS